MALTPSIQTSQAASTVAAQSTVSALRTSQAAALVVANLPSDSIKVSQAEATVVSTLTSDKMRISQVAAIVVGRGRSDDPAVRAWTFTLDGHDFYVLRLGATETLVYDLHSDQWYVWGSGMDNLWRAYTGSNWLGGNSLAGSYGSNVIVGDDGNGALYFLDPYSDADDDAFVGNEAPRQFERIISFQVPTKRYTSTRCFGVEVLGSIGQELENTVTSVNLQYSDDRGITYNDAGSITTPADEYSSRLYWGSLGSIQAPGRIFKITDYGALKRMDSAMMIADGEGST